MSREFELRQQVELDASPEQVWEAIATDPGISSWFMGPHEIEPRVGGAMTLTIGDLSERATITAWDPPKRFAYQGELGSAELGTEGWFHAIEYLVERREGTSTVLRLVHTGALGDDWGSAYEDKTRRSWTMYLHTLGQYLTYFTGRPGTFVLVQGPPVSEGQDAWTTLTAELGLTGPVRTGDRVRPTPQGLAPIEGVVDCLVPDHREFLGVRGRDGLYRFHGGGPRIHAGHHLFGVDGEQATQAWQTWLNQVFAGKASG